MSSLQTRSRLAGVVLMMRVGGFFSGIGAHHSACDRLDIMPIDWKVRTRA